MRLIKPANKHPSCSLETVIVESIVSLEPDAVKTDPLDRMQPGQPVKNAAAFQDRRAVLKKSGRAMRQIFVRSILSAGQSASAQQHHYAAKRQQYKTGRFGNLAVILQKLIYLGGASHATADGDTL